MPDERSRHRLYEELSELMSPESTNELMDYLPPVGWVDVATKSDLSMIRTEMDALRADVRGEIAQLRDELRGDIGELRGEFGALRGEFGELAGRMGLLEGRWGHFEATIERRFTAQTRWLVGSVIASVGLVLTYLQIRL